MPGCPRMPTRPPVYIALCAPPWRRRRRSASSRSSGRTRTSRANSPRPAASPPNSTHEQASAGLNQLTDAERATFTGLNDAYTTKFGFPFIIAVKGLSKADILASFQQRISNDRDTELATALAQVERIALLRLKDMLP